MVLQGEVVKLKKMSDDTVIKVHFSTFKSADAFSGWWQSKCVATDVMGHSIASDVHLCFADALGLMAMSSGTQDSVSTDLEQLSFSYRARQTGFDTSEDAVLYQSISK